MSENADGSTGDGEIQWSAATPNGVQPQPGTFLTSVVTVNTSQGPATITTQYYEPVWADVEGVATPLEVGEKVADIAEQAFKGYALEDLASIATGTSAGFLGAQVLVAIMPSATVTIQTVAYTTVIKNGTANTTYNSGSLVSSSYTPTNAGYTQSSSYADGSTYTKEYDGYADIVTNTWSGQGVTIWQQINLDTNAVTTVVTVAGVSQMKYTSWDGGQTANFTGTDTSGDTFSGNVVGGQVMSETATYSNGETMSYTYDPSTGEATQMYNWGTTQERVTTDANGDTITTWYNSPVPNVQPAPPPSAMPDPDVSQANNYYDDGAASDGAASDDNNGDDNNGDDNNGGDSYYNDYYGY